MFGPLSILTYYRKNKRKVLPVMLVIAFSVVGVSGTASITGSIVADVSRGKNFYEHYNVFDLTVTPETTQLKTQVGEEIQSYSEVKDVVTGMSRWINTMLLVGNSDVPVVFLDPSDYADFLSEMKYELISGQLPEAGSNQLVFTESLLANKDRSVGDHAGNATTDQDGSLPGDFVITGILKEKSSESAMIAVGNLEFFRKQFQRDYVSFFVQPVPGQEAALDHKLSELTARLKQDYPTVSADYFSGIRYQKRVDEVFASMDTITTAIIGLVTLVITVSVVLLNLIFFMQRANEFGILEALGYSKWFIIRKTLLESLGTLTIGWLLGMAMQAALSSLLNKTLFAPNGFAGLDPFTIRNLIYSLYVPLTMAVCSTGIVFWQLLRMDPIAVIERRD